jgi:two-component sensor histidine kinase
VLHQTPSPSVADVFYCSFYPLAALGILYLSKISFNRREELKIIIEMGIVILTFGLIYWTFLIMPILTNQENFLAGIVSVAYIIGDLVLLFVLVRLLYVKVEKAYHAPLILLSAAIFSQIVTDNIYSLQSVQGTYISGGLLDAGWMICFLLIGLSAFLQMRTVNYDLPNLKLRTSLKRSDLAIFLIFILIIVAFTLLVWSNTNLSPVNLQVIELGVGSILILLFIRLVISLKENENLYLAAQNENISRQKAEKELKTSLNEKEVLIKEIHHRVKNNMQIVSSLLELQSLQQTDKNIKKLFKESQNQVRSMAIVHEKLYHSGNLASINIQDYTKSLIAEIFKSYHINENILTNLNIEKRSIDINKAIPLGLILNELINNSLEHAFPNGEKGEIKINLNKNNGFITLNYLDNGVGFPKNLNFQNTNTMGMQMINGLVNQMNGTIKLNRNPGTQFTIKFKT